MTHSGRPCIWYLAPPLFLKNFLKVVPGTKCSQALKAKKRYFSDLVQALKVKNKISILKIFWIHL
jgi:hypothetical protein